MLEIIDWYFTKSDEGVFNVLKNYFIFSKFKKFLVLRIHIDL